MGPAARGAVTVGRLKLPDATDDAGTDLRDREQLKWCEQLQDVNRLIKQFGEMQKLMRQMGGSGGKRALMSLGRRR